VLGLCRTVHGAEEQLQSISSALARETLDKAERILVPWSNPIRTVPRLCLTARGSWPEKETRRLPKDAFVRYQELAPMRPEATPTLVAFCWSKDTMRAPTLLTRRIGKEPQRTCRPGSARRNPSHEGQVKRARAYFSKPGNSIPITSTRIFS